MSERFKRTFRVDRSNRSDARRSVDEELWHHIELCVEELVAEGWEEEAARTEATRRFGDLADTRAYCESMQTSRGREERGRMSIDQVVQDLRYAARALRTAPGYTALVVVTLAFGIAANTTIFSLMNPYLLRELPYEAPEELVHVNQVNPVTGWDMDRFSYPQVVDWTERARGFEAVGGYYYSSANLTGPEGPEQAQYSVVTSNLFDVLGTPAALGRTFRAEEGLPGAEPVVVISHGLWQRRYTADPAIVGRAIGVDGVQRTVVGVMPPDFVFPFGGVRLWIPTRESAAGAARDRTAYQLVGRLADGWTPDAVRRDLSAIQAELSAIHPETDGRMAGVTVKPLREALNFAWDILRVLFAVLLGAVAFVLLIACVNVASLTLARARGRVRELSVRAALGATRSRLIRQLLAEGGILAIAAGALGIGATVATARLLDPVLPEDLYRVGSVEVDVTVLGFCLLVTLATPLVFALLPALDAARADLTVGLKEGSKGSGSVSATRARSALVVTQVALAVVLIAGAGLMLRSFQAVQAIDLGFDAGSVLTAELTLPTGEYPSGEERRAVVTEVVAAVEALGGVEAASVVTWLPLNHESVPTQVGTPETATVDVDEWPQATRNVVYPEYFEAMGIGLLEGRDFGTGDGVDGARVVVVSRSLAERFWPEGGAVGRVLSIDGPDEERAIVVGVVGDIRHSGLDDTENRMQIYEAALQRSYRRFFVVARTGDDPAALVPALRAELLAVLPDVPAVIRPMDDVVAENQLQWSVGSVLLAAMGLGALLLATLGIYGLISYSVSQRAREIGVRVALGASAGEIRSTVVGDGIRLTAIGLGIGLVASLALGRLLAFLLYGTSPNDPLTLGGVALLFLGVAALASFAPAARAAATDPIRVLRAE